MAITKEMVRKRPAKYPSSRAIALLNAASTSKTVKPEMKIELMDRKSLIHLVFADEGSLRPIIGSGTIGAMNDKDIPKKDIFIEPKYFDSNVEGNMVKIYQASSPADGDTGKLMSFVVVDTIDVVNSFRLVGNCISGRTNFMKKVNFSWYIDQRNKLMFNLHLDEATIVWDNIETLEKEMDQLSLMQIIFFGDLVAAVHPDLEMQHIRLVYPEWEKMRRSRNHCCCRRPSPTVADGSLREVDELFHALKTAQTTVPSYKLRLGSLACDLREYQKDAVDFLIHREVEPAINVGLVHKSIQLADGISYLPTLGAFVKDIYNTSVNVVGGILADETGLGKTLEVLCLILSNQNEEDTKELRRTRINTSVGSNDEILNYESDDSAIVNEQANVTEETAVAEIKKCVQSCDHSENSDNTNDGPTSTPGDVHCVDCGEGWPVKKVHWLPEFQQQNLTFKCPTCTAEGPKVPVSATLIVVPKPICQQWYDEIRKLTGDDVQIYKGVDVDGYKSPHYFSKFQIILTTYEVLQKEKEFLHGKQQSAKHWTRQQSTRFGKRRHDGERNIFSPLTSIDWWRVCLDEWQLVAGGLQKEVCFQLQARAKWCISGTPLVKNYYDFQQILRFLRVRPFDRTTIWESIFVGYLDHDNLDTMVEVLAQLLWRNSMEDVENQLHIPPNQDNVINTLLSPIEMERYKLMFIEAKCKMANILQDVGFIYERDFTQITPDQLKDSNDLLNSVRWPLVTGEGYLTEAARDNSKKLTGQTTLDVYKNVLNKAGHEIAKKSRGLTAQINELADHKMRSDKITEAINCYTKVLSTVSEHESKLSAIGLEDWALITPEDTKERMHAIANLIEATSIGPDIVSGEAFDAYTIQLKDLEEGFNKIHSYKESVAKAIGNLAASKEQHAKNNENFKKLLPLIRASVEERTAKSVESITKTPNADCKQIRPKPRNAKPKMITWEELQKKMMRRQNQLDKFLKSSQPWIEIDLSLDGKMLTEISECSHNDNEWDREGNRTMDYSYDCPACLMDTSITDIERNLSIAVMRKHRAMGNCAAGWKRHTVDLAEDPIHMAMKSILQLPEDTSKKTYLEHFEMFEKYMESLRECVQKVNIVMNAIQVIARKSHEIRRATARSSYNLHSSDGISVSQQHKVQDDFLTRNVHRYERVMMTVYTKMSYVETLMKNDEKLGCPVCYEELETSWQMLPCFHSLCNWCYIQFTQQPSEHRTLECVSCRAPFQLSQVDEVMLNGPATVEHSSEPVDQYTIKGVNLSYKMAAVMRNVVSLLEEDPTNKIVVLSEMDSILEMMSHTMESIGFQHSFIRSTKSEFDGLANFKKNSEVKVLLLHLSFASNGLNLVEANHVFFMEPTPNATVYQQAKGRVLRLGQCRSTTIHHLIAKDTIEERIHEVSTDPSEDGLTVRAMRDIFGLF